MNIQMDEVKKLQEAWELRGNPPCDHPELRKEYGLGYATGDYACSTCGECNFGRGWNSPKN